MKNNTVSTNLPVFLDFEILPNYFEITSKKQFDNLFYKSFILNNKDLVCCKYLMI